MSNEQPMNPQEALDFAVRLEQSIDDPIRCQHCGARTYPIAGTRTHHIRCCLSSSKQAFDIYRKVARAAGFHPVEQRPGYSGRKDIR